jgi:hypothetical protein
VAVVDEFLLEFPTRLPMLTPTNIPKQLNGIDCELFVIGFIEAFLLRSPVISAGSIARHKIPEFTTTMMPGVLQVTDALLLLQVHCLTIALFHRRNELVC